MSDVAAVCEVCHDIMHVMCVMCVKCIMVHGPWSRGEHDELENKNCAMEDSIRFKKNKNRTASFCDWLDTTVVPEGIYIYDRESLEQSSGPV